MNVKKNRVVVVSALFMTDKPKMDESGPLDPVDDWDYILFTNDRSTLVDSKVDPRWEIREVECIFEYGVYMTKHIKWMTHEYLPEYDVVIWVDCFYSPNLKKRGEWEALIDIITTDYNRPLMMRTQKFQSVEEDMQWCFDHHRVTKELVQTTSEYLATRGWDVREKSRTYWTSVMIKNNKSSLLQCLSMELMQLVTTRCCRDQHWLPYLFQKYKITCDLFPNSLVICNGVQNRGVHSYEHIDPYSDKHSLSTLRVYMNNLYSVHLEVIETLFTLFLPRLVGARAACGKVQIYLELAKNDHVLDNHKSYVSYLTGKYDHVTIVPKRPENVSFDAEIYPTMYPKFLHIVQPGKQYAYIAHDVLDVYEPYPNVYFLTPLGSKSLGIERSLDPLVLPPIVKKKTDIPIFAFQGRLDPKLKNFKSLVDIFKIFQHFPFKIKLLGKGDPLPFLDEIAGDRILYERNLPFTEYHEAFSDVFALLPLIDDSMSHPYFTNKLTSAVSYGRAYNLWMVCHSRLQEIYHLPKCFVYEGSSTNKFVDAFDLALRHFYQNV